MSFSPLVMWASAASAAAIGAIIALLVPPPTRLRARIAPYLAPGPGSLAPSHKGSVVGSVFGPMLGDAAKRLSSLLDRVSPESMALKLRQSGWFVGADEGELVARYRMTQLRSFVLGAVLALALGQVLEGSAILRLLLLGLGLVVGATRTKGRINKAIDSRRELLKIEIYTVNQLLAMRVRAGGGVIQAVKAMTERGHGEVIGELLEALRLHKAGLPGPEAFRRIADLTPEPYCARTYRLLAAAEERGSDLAEALLALSEDVREARRESIKRSATKRRAAMLVPTIAILAPVLILFVAAPLPYLITAWQ